MNQSPEGGPGGAVIADRYELLQAIGKGGFGTVYKATDIQTGSVVAVKVLAPSQQNVAQRERLSREFALLRGLRHPNIAEILDSGMAGDSPYLVLEYIEGPSLHSLLGGEQSLSVHDVVQIGLDVSSALSYLHERHIVHRDINPTNILMDRAGRSHVIDFGVSENALPPSASAETFSFTTDVGTIGYASPETARRERTDHRSDIYSLGAVLYTLLTGPIPLPPKHPVERGASELPRIRAVRPDVPTWLEHVIMRCLETSPDARFQSAAALAEALLNGAEQAQDVNPLILLVDPGTAPPEFIADILSDISQLYRVAGGSGITFAFDEVVSATGDLV